MKVICSFLLIAITSLAHSQSAESVMEKMLKAIDEIEALSFDFNSQERFGEKMVISEGKAKISIQPRKIYLRQSSPEIVDILYNEVKNAEKALVKAKKLPVVNLSIYGTKMRKRSHHPLTQLGFEPIALLIKDLGSSGEKYIIELSAEIYQGKEYHRLEINYPDYHLEIYKTPTDEYPRDIAKRNKIGEHKIIELNDLKGYGKIKKGYYLTLPNFYAKKVVLLIDKKSHLPLLQYIYDEKGIYERYTYGNLDLSPSFSKNEFLRDFKSER